MNIIPVSNAFDSYGAFVELHEVKAFNKFQISLVIKVHPESIVPQIEPPMLNIIGRLQNSLRRIPVDVDGQLVLKRSDLSLNPLFQLCKKRPTVRNGPMVQKCYDVSGKR